MLNSSSDPNTPIRQRQNVALSPGFPSQQILAHMSEAWEMTEFHFCSVQEPGAAPVVKPQLIKMMKDPVTEWAGRVMIFVSISRTKGRSEDWWRQCFAGVGMQIVEEVERPLTHRRLVWKNYAYKAGEPFATELFSNVILTDMPERTLIVPPPAAACSSAPAGDPKAQVEDKLALPEVEPGQHPKAGLVQLTAEKRKQYIEASNQADDDRVFEGQHKKQKSKYSLSSKKEKSAKAKPTEPAAKTGGAAKEKPKPVAVALNLNERVLHAAMSGTSSDAWKTAMAAWLTKRDVYSKASQREDGIVALLRRVIPVDKNTESFFSVKNKRGIGVHYPSKCPSTETKNPSTVELHRAALCLENLCQEMLAGIESASRKVSPPEFLAKFQAPLSVDVMVALQVGGGMKGQGTDYWAGAAALPAEPSSKLLPTIEKLASLRSQAFHREYLICDENSWGLPILSTVFIVNSENDAGAKYKPVEWMYRIQRLNNLRQSAIMADRWSLVQYGSLLSVYARTLCEAAAVLGVERMASTATVFDGLPPLRTQDRAAVIACRLDDEKCDLRTMLTGLFVTGNAAAVEMTRSVNKAVAAAMKEDSYQRTATIYLFPTASLTYATCEPHRYLSVSFADKAKPGHGGK